MDDAAIGRRDLLRREGAIIAVIVLGSTAVLAFTAFVPAQMLPLPAAVMKALYGGLVAVATTPLILRMVVGMPSWEHKASPVLL